MAIKAAKKNDLLELELSGVVGDGWAENPITSKEVRKSLKDAGEVSEIRLKLNSPGGYVVEGLEIYQMLADHEAKVKVTVGAQAASSASLIAMAGDEITLHESSLFLVHNPWNITMGDYVAHRAAADELEMMADVFAGVYASRSDESKEEIRKLMDEDRYMSAEETKKRKLCSAIIKSKGNSNALSADQARAMLMKSRSFAMNRLMQTAAAALLNIDNPPAQSAPEVNTATKEEMMTLALLVAALGLPEGASETDAVGAINGLKNSKDTECKLLEALGAKSTDDALGRIQALKGSDERAAKAEQELDQMRAEAIKTKRDALIAAALDPKSSSPHAGKLTPAQKAWAEGVSLETLEGFLAVAPAVLKGDGKKEPARSDAASKTNPKASDPAPTWNGKTFAELKPMQRLALAEENEELYHSMREHALATGAI